MKSLVLIAFFGLLSLPAQGSAPTPSTSGSGTLPSIVFTRTAETVQILTGVGTAYLLFASFNLTKRLKRGEILLEFFRRFDALVERRESIQLSGPKTDSSHYYERFWNLQNDEFTMWREGYIEDKSYRAWLDVRHEEYRVNESTGDKSYQEGWDHYANINKDAEFQSFMREVFSGKTSEVMNAYKTIS
jgi:hypothetical protein